MSAVPRIPDTGSLRRRRRTARSWRPAVLVALLAASVLASGTSFATPPTAPAAATPAARVLDTVDPADRDRILPADWRTSKDTAWTTAGDSRGFRLMLAESRTGYTWRTAAILSEPGVETDQWIGNACLVGSGRRAVVVYAPRAWTNRQQLFDRGAFTAIVDLRTGAVVKLPLRASLAYYNPGCGAGETAVLTQGGAADIGRTRLHVLDTVRGTVTRRHEVAGQVTSAVPVGDEIVAAAGGRLVGIAANGALRTVTRTTATAFSLRPDAAGGLVYLERQGSSRAVVRRVDAEGRPIELGGGPLTDVELQRGQAGQVFLTGNVTLRSALPASVTRLATPAHAEISTFGRLVLRPAPRPTGRDAGAAVGTPALRATVLATGRTVDFRLEPALDRVGSADIRHGAAPAPVGGTDRRRGKPAVTRVAAGSPTDPTEGERTCAVARNDPRIQVYQPHWRQVEWAADLAVQDALTVQRPANWRQSGLDAWSPQGMFPSQPLAGGGRVPASVLLGVLAQESNLWQASSHALEGVYGNPLVGSYYGNDVYDGDETDDWTVRWSEADCGYGVGQVTDGMRLGSGLAPIKQRAIALDYATNVAAALQILQQKWNQTYAAGIRMNDADPSRIENWYAAVWAYNSGVNPQASTGNTTGCTPGTSGCWDANGMWGLGYTNNPANADYEPNRLPFLELSQDDARYPNRWPYPEKVIGWAAYPIVKYDRPADNWDSGYLQAWWSDPNQRSRAGAPLDAFCRPEAGVTGNLCDPAHRPEPCLLANFHCWWHLPVTWKPDCAVTCGHDQITFAPGAAEPADGANYPPPCGTGLPANALIVDDVPASVPETRSCSARTWINNGTFALRFAGDGAGSYPSKIDFHQIGAGFGSHFWFAHTRTSGAEGGRLAVEGTWTLNRSITGWARVLVHVPDHGAHTQEAAYSITLNDRTIRKRVVQQRIERNRWVSLGAFPFAGVPKVGLSTATAKGDGSEDVAWDAVAFVPLPGKPRNQVVVLGDSFTSGEGASELDGRDYYPESDNEGGTPYRNACHRSTEAWSRKAVLADRSTVSIGAREDTADPTMDFHLIACSGAVTANLTVGGKTSYREPSQLDKGYLDENTTLVMLSIGGNDARFGKVVQQCTVTTPAQGLPCMSTTLAGDLDLLVVAEPRAIDASAAATGAVVRQVHLLAPNAKIVLAGYPQLFSVPGGGSNGGCLPGLWPDETEWVRSMTARMDVALADQVRLASSAGIRVAFGDPTADFDGHGACAADPALHKLVLTYTPGEDPPPNLGPSQQSLHPNRGGTTRYASAVNRALRTLGL